LRIQPQDVSPTTTRTLLSRPQRQAQLRRAAATAFARTGFAATSMDDVAREAGVSRLIVYRNFDSKADLYRAVLSGVRDRLRDEFLAGTASRDTDPAFPVHAMVTVAREDPDGFRLLWRHAARESEFRDLAEDFHDRSVAAVEDLGGEGIPDPALRRWATVLCVDFVVQAVLGWLDHGDPRRDDELERRIVEGIVALYPTWQ
jgi:AcrR family transcriptional regulator